MNSRIQSDGHGSFFLLPDLPSSSDPSLPSLCFCRSLGLLSRSANPGDLLISDSLLPFGSNREEDLDSVTVDERFVDNVVQFVEAMDGVSGGRFLRGEEKGVELEKEWAELGWLKEKGYYSLETYVANRLEVVAAGALRRKKGCVDWWEKLDSRRRKGFCTSFVGKTANSLNLGSLLTDFLYFFGNVFDPRQMRISIRGVYMKRERGLSIDPLHIDDPLFPSNNVGRNCFRIHQCIKVFADAYILLENELEHFSVNCAPSSKTEVTLLRKLIPSIDRG